MPDLISREALKQFPVRRDHYDKENGNENFISGVESVLEYAEQLPAVDTVLVVRCKECCYFRAANIPSCTSPYGIIDPDPDDFCSYGERRGDNAAD